MNSFSNSEVSKSVKICMLTLLYLKWDSMILGILLPVYTEGVHSNKRFCAMETYLWS